MGITRHLTQTAIVSRLCQISQRLKFSSMKVCACRLNYNKTNEVIKKHSFSTEKKIVKSTESSQKGNSSEIDIARESPYAGLSFGEKVKEVGKDVSYTGFIVASIGVLGAIFYAVFREMFSRDSPNGVYDRAFKRCLDDTELSAALGEPIKGYGETTRRGRRRHVSHTEYMVEDQKRMRMQFYVEGTDKKGTVQLEMMKDTSGRYNFRFLLVQLNEYPYRTFILEDNR